MVTSDSVLSPQSNLVGGSAHEPIPADDIAISVRNVLRPAAGPLEAGLSVGPAEALPRVL